MVLALRGLWKAVILQSSGLQVPSQVECFQRGRGSFNHGPSEKEFCEDSNTILYYARNTDEGRADGVA